MEDIEFLHSALQVNVVSMSSWDMYAKEVRSLGVVGLGVGVGLG